MTSDDNVMVDPIVQRLQALAHESPDLGDAARLYEAVLPLLRDTDLGVLLLPLTVGEVRVRLESGLPLLTGSELDFDVDAAGELMLQMTRAVENSWKTKEKRKSWLPWRCTSELSNSGVNCNGVLNVAAPRQIREALEHHRLNVGELLALSAVGDNSGVTEVARDLSLDPGLLQFLAGYTLKAALHAWRRQIAPLTLGIPWDNGYCLICGSAATLGELQDNDQIKHLRCGQCGADWRFRRLLCVRCGNDDHNTQRFLYHDSRQDNKRVEVCDRCSGYLKVITTFAPTPPEMISVEDLATLHMDYIARDRGYAHAMS